MSLGLPNAKFGIGQPVQRLGLGSRRHKVAPSIAEQAIFIPKPHKRVEFKMNVPGGGGEPIPLPGSGQRAEAEVADSLTRGELGPNGVTARFGKAAWSGAPAGYVSVEVDMTPDKQGEVIATQEEGRQVNHHQVHFTQQYDAYGRPRIGFSREPYDFAATKYMSLTSQIAFQQNVSQTRDRFDEYLLNGADGGDEPKIMGQEEEKTHEVPIFGSTSGVDEGEKPGRAGGDEMFLGPKPSMKESPVGMSAEDAFKASRVEVVEVFGGGKDDGPDPADSIFKGPVDTSSARTLDVTA